MSCAPWRYRTSPTSRTVTGGVLVVELALLGGAGAREAGERAARDLLDAELQQLCDRSRLEQLRADLDGARGQLAALDDAAGPAAEQARRDLGERIGRLVEALERGRLEYAARADARLDTAAAQVRQRLDAQHRRAVADLLDVIAPALDRLAAVAWALAWLDAQHAAHVAHVLGAGD